jgi:hypothetical protein
MVYNTPRFSFEIERELKPEYNNKSINTSTIKTLAFRGITDYCSRNPATTRTPRKPPPHLDSTFGSFIQAFCDLLSRHP